MEQEGQKYNGWSNYETWTVSLWLGNDEATHNYWTDAAHRSIRDSEANRYMTKREAAEIALADRLKDEVNAGNRVQGASLYADLLNAALSEVNWHEIAKSMIEDIS